MRKIIISVILMLCSYNVQSQIHSFGGYLYGINGLSVDYSVIKPKYPTTLFPKASANLGLSGARLSYGYIFMVGPDPGSERWTSLNHSIISPIDMYPYFVIPIIAMSFSINYSHLWSVDKKPILFYGNSNEHNYLGAEISLSVFYYCLKVGYNISKKDEIVSCSLGIGL